eukprot:SAG22_NODE_764_length_7397_cov_6.955604_10_plen_191_part_00
MFEASPATPRPPNKVCTHLQQGQLLPGQRERGPVDPLAFGRRRLVVVGAADRHHHRVVLAGRDRGFGKDRRKARKGTVLGTILAEARGKTVPYSPSASTIGLWLELEGSSDQSSATLYALHCIVSNKPPPTSGYNLIRGDRGWIGAQIIASQMWRPGPLHVVDSHSHAPGVAVGVLLVVLEHHLDRLAPD